MIRFLIYDDNKASCEELRNFIFHEMKQENFDIHIALNRQEAEHWMKQNISVLFLDIALENGENGINFARYVNATYPNTKIVFITAYIKYCEEIFVASPSGFLVKPFTAGKVARVLEILRDGLQKEDFLIINSSKNNITKLALNEIAYIESINRKLVFYRSDGEKIHEFLGKISSLESDLPDYFFRCHHSFYVNLHFVSKIQRYRFTLTIGIDVPISQNKFKPSKEKFMYYLGEML